MTYTEKVEVRKEANPLPLYFILLFYSGTVIAPHAIFPVLTSFFPQTILAGAAILLAVLYIFSGNTKLRIDQTQLLYIAYCFLTTVGLYRSAEVGCLVKGEEVVAIIWKQLIFIIILISFSRTLSSIHFVRTWILVTIALFILHSIKAIAMGHSGLAGRFDNYVGLISNSDYIGVFTAIFVVIFMHIGLKAKVRWKGIVWFVLSLFSLIIMIKTHTRAAVFVLIILLPCWIILTFSTTAELFKKAILILLLAVTFAIAGLVSSSDQGSYFDRIATITKFDSEDADFNTKSRLFMWKQGIKIGSDNLLLGVGPGATAPYLNLIFEDVELRDKGSKAEGFSFHNTFIQIFADRGVSGLILFCLLLFFAFKNFKSILFFAKKEKNIVLCNVCDIGRLYLLGFIAGGMFITIDYDWTLQAFIALSVSGKQYVTPKSKKKLSKSKQFFLSERDNSWEK